MEEVLAFTDGACLGNPGPGGYAALLRIGSREREISGGEAQTTNNRMELMAAIVALEALKRPVKVRLTSDSQYVLKGMREWIHGWKARGWRTKDRKDVSNRDLWERLDRAAAPHDVEWVWVKGHAGHAENERVDRLANAAAESFRGGGGPDAAAKLIADVPETAGATETLPGGSGEATARAGKGEPGGREAAAGAGSLEARLDGRVHVGCALAGLPERAGEAPAWCELGAGNTGVHCLRGSGEAICPHAVPSFALERLEVADERGRRETLGLDESRAGPEGARAGSLLRALGVTGEPPKRTPRKRRK